MEVPSDIQQRYLERRKKDLEECLNYLERHHFEEIEKVGHQLKGNGVTFGHPELSEIGKKMESAAHAHDKESVEVILKDFSQWVHTLH